MDTFFFTLAFQQGAAPNPIFQFVPVIVIFAIFYFLLIAPMRKRQKALQALVENLKKGDRVVTNGGLHGEVSAVKDGVVLLSIADNVKVKVSKSAVAGMQGQEEQS
jgi:preprotein translocase subunit YajC